MKIVFMSGGARDKALRYLLENGENVVAVVTPCLTEKNRRFEKVITTAKEYAVSAFTVTKETVANVLSNIDYDILVSCGFSYILPEQIINAAKYAINVHPTLLPKYRGYRSGPYVVINGETKTGVTVHFISQVMDDGDILAQQEIEVTLFDTTKSLFRKCQEVEPELLFDVIQKLKNNNFKSIPQNQSQATTYNDVRTPKDSEIDPSKPLLELYNYIRACDPNEYPAFFYVDGQKVCIKMWRPDKSDEEFDLI